MGVGLTHRSVESLVGRIVRDLSCRAANMSAYPKQEEDSRPVIDYLEAPDLFFASQVSQSSQSGHTHTLSVLNDKGFFTIQRALNIHYSNFRTFIPTPRTTYR